MSGTVPSSGKATVDALSDHWGTMMAAYMHRGKLGEIVINTPELARLQDDPGQPTLVVQELADGIHIKLLPIREAVALARQNKTGFGKS